MIIGTHSLGSASAVKYSTLDELLTQLPDNTANLIDSSDVRDSVYTLWDRISDVQILASQSASASVLYTNLTPTIQTIGGILSGSTFSNRTMQQMWDKLLYPYIALSVYLSGGDTRELGSSNTLTLNWSVTSYSYAITTITVNGISYTPVGGNQSGSQAATSTQNINTTLSMTASDGVSTLSATTTVYWLNAVYYGTTPTFAIPPMTIVGSSPTWANGAGVGSGKTLTSTLTGTYNGINGGGDYIVFAWPTSYGSPLFTINGLPNTAWSKIGNSISFANMHGYTTNYDVWISNTAQNSPITLFTIS